MKHKILMAVVRVMAGVTAGVLAIWCIVAQPTPGKNAVSGAKADPMRLRVHVVALSETMYPRNYQAITNLDRCAGYIAGHFAEAGAQVEPQEFKVHGKAYRNIIGRFGAGKGRTLVVGAHYDACDDTPGADDNASGVAALIELAYLVGGRAPDREIELVAYTLEEPPFFRSEWMGSAVHAKRIAEDKRPITGMIALEMVGYYSDKWGSQSYPVPMLRLMYPSRGNFVGVIGRWDQGPWIKKVKAGMKGATDLPVYSIRAPSALQGVDYSDHLNYWAQGIPAVMVTDTAFLRNRAYHSTGDTPDRLDYVRMGKVVVAVYESLWKL